MRGYFYRAKQRLAYKCHNCNASMWLGAVIKHVAPLLYKEYSIEVLKELRPGAIRLARLLTQPGFFDAPSTQVRFDKLERVIYQHAERISDLPEGHYCREYVKGRQIPNEMWSKLYYTEKYKDFLDELIPDHEKKIQNDARLVIPYYDAYDAIIAVTGRALFSDRDTIRYVTVRTNKDTNKLVYGLDRVDQSKRVYVVEGPLDSLFLDNAVASGDSNLIMAAKELSAADVVLVFDNERRQVENRKQMEKAIKLGYSVVVWPEWIKEKDINAMILAGRTKSQVQSIIHNHVSSGLTALTHLAFWNKIPPQKRRLAL